MSVAWHREEPYFPARNHSPPSDPPPGMLDTFTIDTFRPHVGQTFRMILDRDGAEVVAELAEVTAWGEELARADGGRIPFSLLFRTAARTHVPQATYRIESEAMPPFELFLVPLGADEKGMRYEAVFT